MMTLSDVLAIKPRSVRRTNRKSLAELNYPELVGEFWCHPCEISFSHIASLNRHRKVIHNTEVKCLICDCFMQDGETVHGHLHIKHGVKGFSCTCCNYTYSDKSAFIAHHKSMKEHGEPGDTQPVAKGSNPPGSWMQRNNKRAHSVVSSEGSESSEGSTDHANLSDSTDKSNVAPPPAKRAKRTPSLPIDFLKQEGPEYAIKVVEFLEQLALAHPVLEEGPVDDEVDISKMPLLDRLLYEMERQY